MFTDLQKAKIWICCLVTNTVPTTFQQLFSNKKSIEITWFMPEDATGYLVNSIAVLICPTESLMIA